MRWHKQDEQEQRTYIVQSTEVERSSEEASEHLLRENVMMHFQGRPKYKKIPRIYRKSEKLVLR